MAKSDFFWTDSTQASERLSRTIILYDGDPVFVEAVATGEDDACPRLTIIDCATQKSSRKRADSPKFDRYRKMPNLGWINSTVADAPVFAERRTHTTRSHGLTNQGVPLFVINGSGAVTACGFTFSSIQFDKGFVNSHHDRFPSLDSTIRNIVEGTAIAISRKMLVWRDMDGLRWLFLHKNKVGIFTGSDTLNLLQKFSYLREEIMAEKAFTISKIREF